MMNETNLMVVGGSAGSLHVILETLKDLDTGINFPIVLVLHRKAQSNSVLQVLLQQYSSLEVIEVEDKTEISDNKIYIVPADYHLLFENETLVSLDSSEKINYSRPSIDITFTSAAEIFGENLVAVLLSGANADGVEGLQNIKKNNGTVWIQDPETAQVNYMPKTAMERVEYDLIFKPKNLANHIKNIIKKQ